MPDSIKPEPIKTSEAPPNTIRLNKAIADTGYCARRKADELISAGRVQVNGQTVTEMGTRIDPAHDVITMNGQPLKQAEKAYLLFHKPTGYVTSRRGGRTGQSIYALLPPEQRSVDPAGRLDQESSGALLLTNDGDFLFQITHPRFHLPKLYEITLDRPLAPEEIEQLLIGIELTPENKIARMSRVTPSPNDPCRYQVELITGYNRQIRRSLTEMRARVLTLHRLSFGPIQLGDLKPGQIRPLSQEEQASMLNSASQPIS
jgi:23S rRNA pseudouridine2605 synthase